MKADAILDVVRALDEGGIRFLIVGGLAVMAYGVVRATVDVDLVIDLEGENCRKAMEILARLGFRPRAPVPIADFADPAKRQRWIAEKEMLVFTVQRDQPPFPLEIDVFVAEPFPMAEAYAQAHWQRHASGTRFPFVDLPRLLEMKRVAGRPKDLFDIAELRRLHPEVR